MLNCLKIRMKVFTVEAHNPDTDRDVRLELPVTGEQLRAAHDTGFTTDNLLSGLLERAGFSFNRRIGKPRHQTVWLDLIELARKAGAEPPARQSTGNVWLKQRVSDLDGYDPENDEGPV